MEESIRQREQPEISSLLKKFKNYNISNEGGRDQYYFTESLATLRSWETQQPLWLHPPKEIWKNVETGESWSFILSNSENPQLLQIRLENEIYSLLSSDPECRRYLINWEFQMENVVLCNKGRNGATIKDVASRIFDGMRNLPYTDRQVATSISRGLVLFLLVLQHDRPMSQLECFKVISPFIPDAVELEIASNLGYLSKGFTSRAGILKCLRGDLQDLLKPEFQAFPREEMLQDLVTNVDPDKLFEFDLLTEIFIENLIPSQAVIRRLDSPLYFTPAIVSHFEF
jgi:hypothetical protein